MNLDDPKMIQQAKETTIQEVEVIYWLLETAIDAGKITRARLLFSDMAYLGKYNPKMIKDGLQPPYRNRLREITYELHDNESVKRRPQVTMKEERSPRKIPFKTEKELSDYLLDNSHLLSDALGESVRITGREVELQNDYRCDIVVESKTRLYPVELKIAQSTHAVVSQCSKYCYYFYRQLRYSRFKFVQGVVVANGFDFWSINAIRKEGHWILEILPTDNGIRLSRIIN